MPRRGAMPAASSDELHSLRDELRAFAAARDWAPFHSPKNLACALSVEAAELLEHFQWLSEEQSRQLNPEQRAAVASEMADVLLYLLQMGNELGIDVAEAARAKMLVNAKRFPVEPKTE
jgi:NTP pyrophosphatase (non-canonical NTP hydrolase)